MAEMAEVVDLPVFGVGKILYSTKVTLILHTTTKKNFFNGFKSSYKFYQTILSIVDNDYFIGLVTADHFLTIS